MEATLIEDNNDSPCVKIQTLPHFAGLREPRYAHEGDSGFDLAAAFEDVGMNLVMYPGDIVAIPTGLCFEIPNGVELQVRPRSGLALNSGITVLNAPGTIDAGYRGEVKVILINHSRDAFTIKRGDRIAQAVFGLVLRPPMRFRQRLKASDRGENGFGSSGVAA